MSTVEERSQSETYTHSSKTALVAFLDRLLEPAASVDAPLRSKVRSFSTLLLFTLFMLPFGFLFDRGPTIFLFIVEIIIIGAFFLSRTKFHYISGYLALVILSALPFMSVISVGDFDHDRIINAFIWLVLPMLLAGFVLNLKGIMLLMGAYLVAIASMPLFISALSFIDITDVLLLIGMVSGFTLLVTKERESNVRELVISEQRKITAEILRDSEEKYHNLFEYANDAIFLIDPSTLKIMDANRVASKNLGFSREELLAKGLIELQPNDDANRTQEFIDILHQDKSVLYETDLICKDGSLVCVEISSRLIEYGEGHVIQSIIRDISARKEAEEQLKQFSDRLSALHQIEHAMISTQSPEEISKVALTRLREVVRCKRVDILSFDFEANEAKVHAIDEEEALNSPLTTGARVSLDDFVIKQEIYDGSVYINNDLRNNPSLSTIEKSLINLGINNFVNIPLFVRGDLWGALNLAGSLDHEDFSSQNVDVAQEVAGLVSVALQQSTLFREIKLGRARLQALSRRLVEVQEAERYRIANELHDEIGQALTGINLTLETHLRSLDSSKDYAPLRSAQEMAEELVVRVQRMSLDLRPAMLDDLGLLPTLTWHLDRYEGQTGIRVNFEHQDLQGRFPREIETAAYRIVQEALTNVARHSKVKEVQVRATLNNDVLLIFIEDRGEGFSLDTALSSGNASGLVGMRERALSLGGDLKIISTEESGTQVLAELPLIEQVERRTTRR